MIDPLRLQLYISIGSLFVVVISLTISFVYLVGVF